jgi:dTDP-4-dehydrorhamnose reductase
VKQWREPERNIPETGSDGPIGVLVFGSSGMAGHVIRARLGESGFAVTGAGRTAGQSVDVTLDLSSDDQVAGLLHDVQPAIVINCVGTLVAASDRSPRAAIETNALLPHRLREASEGVGARLIHLSTDCVFSGARGRYREDDLRDGDTIYDRSKALGEISAGGHLTLRMSIVGPEIRAGGTGLLHWFLGQTGAVAGYSRAMWNGITTLELADALVAIATSELDGIYQLVPPLSISKADLLRTIATAFARPDIIINDDASVVVDKTLVDTRGSCPHDLGGADYGDMFRRMAAWVAAHPELYESDPRYRIGRGG